MTLLKLCPVSNTFEQKNTQMLKTSKRLSRFLSNFEMLLRITRAIYYLQKETNCHLAKWHLQQKIKAHLNVIICLILCLCIKCDNRKHGHTVLTQYMQSVKRSLSRLPSKAAPIVAQEGQKVLSISLISLYLVHVSSPYIHRRDLVDPNYSLG